MMEPITIEITILTPVQKVWDYFNDPEHIVNWNFPSEEWHCTAASNDLRVGGKLETTLETKDGNYGITLTGIYDEIIPLKRIRYDLEDGRKVETQFEAIDHHTTKVTQFFDPEPGNSAEMQRNNWYAVLDNFHKYVEKS